MSGLDGLGWPTDDDDDFLYGVGEGSRINWVPFSPLNKQTTNINTMPLDEDLRRYTAPPDNPPEERTYYTSDILDYIESCFPKMSISAYSTYSIDEIRNMLREAADNLTDEDYGIQTI